MREGKVGKSRGWGGEGSMLAKQEGGENVFEVERGRRKGVRRRGREVRRE